MSVHVRVDGVPVPQGSKNSQIRRNKAGRQFVSLFDDNDRVLRPWRKKLAWSIQAAREGTERGPCRVRIEFRFPRPKSRPKNHHGWHTVKPDKDKLVRAVFDALKEGRAWVDDAQACDIRVTAVEIGEPGVDIHVTPILGDAFGNPPLTEVS